VQAHRAALARWAELFASGQADQFKEHELLHDFLTEIFCGLLGYTRVVDNSERYTFSREKYVEGEKRRGRKGGEKVSGPFIGPSAVPIKGPDTFVPLLCSPFVPLCSLAFVPSLTPLFPPAADLAG